MDILVVGGELDLARLHVGQNRFQALRDGSGVGFFNDAGIAQHLGVGQRAWISSRYIRWSKEMEELKSLTRASVSF